MQALRKFYPAMSKKNAHGFCVSRSAWDLLGYMVSKVSTEGAQKYMFFQSRENTALDLYYGTDSRVTAEKCVKQATNILVKAGLITCVSAGRRGKTSIYRLNIEELYAQVSGWDYAAVYSRDPRQSDEAAEVIKTIAWEFTPRALEDEAPPDLASIAARVALEFSPRNRARRG